jgi:hypothetical protein
MFEAAKNLMISKGAQMYANKLISRYGVVNDLKIDPQKKTVDAVCQLHGETTPITVRVERYSVVEKAGKKYVQVSKCSCSRPWAQALVEDFIVGKQVEVPAWAVDSL